MQHRPNILSIAGFDPSGGAGVIADCKTAEALACYGHAVITSNTFQNQDEFDSVDWVDTSRILNQIDVLLRKNMFSVVKIGLVKDIYQLADIIEFLKDKNIEAIIWDPILKASAGFEFHSEEISLEIRSILKKIQLITPNRNEAMILWNSERPDEIQNQLPDNGGAVLLKGGHAEAEKGTDLFITKKTIIKIAVREIFEAEKHGSGCVLSSAIACGLANGLTMSVACKQAKNYIEKFLQSNDTLLGYHY